MISVCMATYNGQKFICEQLESILSQLSNEDEVIIVDDVSNDSTVKMIELINDSRIKLFLNKKNIGPVKSFEKALNLSKGEFIFFADQDDYWLKNKVKVVMETFQDNKCSLVIHDAKVTDENLEVTNDSWNRMNHNYFSDSWIKTVVKNPFTGANMAMRRDIMASILPFPVNIPMHDWWIGAISQKKKVKICIIRKPLILYRRHGNNVTGSGHNLRKMIHERIKLFLALWRN